MSLDPMTMTYLISGICREIHAPYPVVFSSSGDVVQTETLPCQRFWWKCIRCVLCVV